MYKLRVYIAGPMTNGDGNTYNPEKIREALEAYSLLIRYGFLPFCPQLSLIHAMMLPQDVSYAEWLEHDFSWIDICDVVLRIPGPSKGADRECEYAEGLGIRVVEGLDNFLTAYPEPIVCKTT
ncbi:hypothetical protein LCGC14_1476270 [marine sediment metagenome]|uniref:DUF4406 domain-containing protein n=1 Tax=marine sediment metagenome TaxID=412755 RepID=A0A0F9MCK8_9ZZZZ